MMRRGAVGRPGAPWTGLPPRGQGRVLLPHASIYERRIVRARRDTSWRSSAYITHHGFVIYTYAHIQA